MIRNFMIMMLSGVLALASVSLAQARHYDHNGLKMVLCTDDGYQTIVLDAQGNPVPITHPCPDCVAAMAAQDLPAPLKLLVPNAAPQMVVFAQISRDAAGRMPPPSHARGPPLLM
jgi:hypothetical protein